MNIPTIILRLKGVRFPRKIIAYAVWSCHRFALSTAGAEQLLAARGVIAVGKQLCYGSIALVDTF